jgi:predicted Fe-Mo cluster-binding NifX family protein
MAGGASSGHPMKALMLRRGKWHDQSEATWDVGGESPMEIARRLVSLDIQYVICGGIHRTYKDWLIRNGITVMENRRGIAREVIKELLNEFKSDGHDSKRASSFIGETKKKRAEWGFISLKVKGRQKDGQ